MDLNIERELLKKELDSIDDIKLFEAIRKLLDYAKSKTAKAYKPMSEDEYLNRILESRKAIGDGKLIAQEEAIAYFRRKNG